MKIFILGLVLLLPPLTLFLLFRHRDRQLHKITAALTAAPSATVVYRLPFLSQRHVVTANLENVQHMLKTNFQNYPKGANYRALLHDLLGDCMVNADGATWRLQRVFAARHFSVSFLHFYGDSILDSELFDRLLPFLGKVAGGTGVVDLQDVLLRFAFDNVCRAAFSFDPACLTGSDLPWSEFAEAFDRGVFLISRRLKSMMPMKVVRMKKILNIGSERELKEAVVIVKRLAMSIVKDKRIEHQKAPVDEKLENEDFLSKMLKSSTAKENNLDDEFMANMVVGIILAGRDTTSSVLTWFFWLVSMNPNVEKRILEEIKNARKRPNAYETAKELMYTHAALCETMRLYPPIPVDMKEVVNDDVLPDGTALRRGDRVVILKYAMGRMAGVWGDDWPEFKPERWLEREAAGEGRWRFVGKDPFTFPVFNAGPRICLGKEMAFIQMKRVAMEVLRRFRVVPAGGREFQPEYVFDLTAKIKGGFPVRVERREEEL